MADDDNAGTESTDGEAKLIFVKKTGQLASKDVPDSTFVTRRLQESKDDSRDQD